MKPHEVTDPGIYQFRHSDGGLDYYRKFAGGVWYSGTWDPKSALAERTQISDHRLHDGRTCTLVADLDCNPKTASTPAVHVQLDLF